MRMRISCWLIGFVTALICLSWMPLPNAFLRQFENANYAPKGSMDGYAGVVVLGGGLQSRYVVFAGQQVQLSEASDRMLQAVALLQKHPQFLMVYTSQDDASKGAAALVTSAPSQAERFFKKMGVAPDRLIMEGAATTTRENAVFTAALPGIDITRPWLLLTSASHMPRALATFRKVGWNVTAYPVDYLSKRHVSLLDFSLAGGAALWQDLAYEGMAWIEYRLWGWV